jgi:hypothetical protein
MWRNFQKMRRAVWTITCSATVSIALAWQGAGRAVVSGDSVNLYSKMSAQSVVIRSLRQGDVVSVDFVVNSPEGAWCAVRETGPSARAGYIQCQDLSRERHVAPPEAAPAERPPEAPSVPSSAQEALVEEALDLSGVEAILARAREQMDPRLARRQGLSEREMDLLKRVQAEWFETGAFREAITGKLRARFSPERVSALLDGVRSPLVRKMIELETQVASAPLLATELSDFSLRLQTHPPTPQRVALIQRLDGATQTSETISRAVIAMMRGAARQIDPTVPAEMRLQHGDLDKLIQRFKYEYQPAIQQGTRMRLLYAYRSIADKELEDYVRWRESAGAVWFATAVNEALSEAAFGIGENMFRQLNMLKKSKRLIW